MSTCPDQQEPRRDYYRDAPPSRMNSVAEQLIALVEEFEAELGKGNVPPAFAERLAQLRQSAERLK